MKTHELAKALTHLSRVLRAGPNVNFEELTNLSTYASQPRTARATRELVEKTEMTDKGTGLVLLAQMANYSKMELLDLANHLGIPVEVRKADAVRDVLGKILKYIQENPGFRDIIVHRIDEKESATKTSSLARALAILMNQP
jgi:hypothetical protein